MKSDTQKKTQPAPKDKPVNQGNTGECGVTNDIDHIGLLALIR